MSKKKPARSAAKRKSAANSNAPSEPELYKPEFAIEIARNFRGGKLGGFEEDRLILSLLAVIEKIDNAKPNRDGDVVVDMGNLTDATIEQAPDNDEMSGMVEDYVDTFNHAVLQGMAPIRALVALVSATGILLGCAIRCGLRKTVWMKLIAMQGHHCNESMTKIQIITKN